MVRLARFVLFARIKRVFDFLFINFIYSKKSLRTLLAHAERKKCLRIWRSHRCQTIKKITVKGYLLNGAPGAIRTRDLSLKRGLLYRLSYRRLFIPYYLFSTLRSELQQFLIYQEHISMSIPYFINFV